MQDNAAKHSDSAPVTRPIDVVRSAYDAFGRRDLAAIQALHHPACELFQSALLPWGGTYRGHDGLMQFFARLTGAIETQIVDEQLFEAEDRVVSIGRTRGRSLGSGRQFDLPAVHIYTVEDGKIRRFEAYVDTLAMVAACTA